MMDNSRLFENYKLKYKVEVSRRLFVSPMVILGVDNSGNITDEDRSYLAHCAKGIGLYILGAEGISPEGKSTKNQALALSEKDIPSLEERPKIIKDQGALAISQIMHAGLLGTKKYSGKTPLCPSKDVSNKHLEKSGKLNDDNRNDEMINDDILRIIVNSTEWCLKAGYDWIEIHGANNYLMQQFYSVYYNKRNDEWDCSLEKWMRFPLEIVDACYKIRDKYNKPEYIIGYRLSPEEKFENSITMTNTISLIKALIQRTIQYIHISQGNYFQEGRKGEGAGIPRLKFVHELIKGKVALIGIGGLISDKDFNKALNSGNTNFIAAGRVSLLKKDLAILLKEGKDDKINLELELEHPEKYSFPIKLWDLCLIGGNWLPPIKGKFY